MICTKCSGKGSIGHESKDATGNVTIYTTELCECRRSMPRRYGKASWWHKEIVYTDSLTLVNDELVITVDRELPITEGNYPVHRTAENCYFQPLAEISVDEYGLRLRTADDLRELAAWLVKTADKMDELGQPYPDEQP